MQLINSPRPYAFESCAASVARAPGGTVGGNIMISYLLRGVLVLFCTIFAGGAGAYTGLGIGIILSMWLSWLSWGGPVFGFLTGAVAGLSSGLYLGAVLTHTSQYQRRRHALRSILMLGLGWGFIITATGMWGIRAYSGSYLWLYAPILPAIALAVGGFARQEGAEDYSRAADDL